MPQLSRDEIADIFEHIAQLLELKGEVVFKVRAYQNAARALEGFNGNLAQFAKEERLGEIPGVGKAIAEKIAKLLDTGVLPYYEGLKAEFPPGIFEIAELQGVGPKKIKAMWDQLGITTLAELEAGARTEASRRSGFGKRRRTTFLPRSVAREHAGAFGSRDRQGRRQMLADLRRHSDVLQAVVAGGYRRRKEIVGDLDFIVATNAPADVSSFREAEMVEAMAHGATKSSVRFRTGFRPLRVVKNTGFRSRSTTSRARRAQHHHASARAGPWLDAQ